MVLRVPAIAACALAVVTISATLSMLEPVLALHLGTLGVNPGRIGLIYGAAAVATTALHPVCGRLADRFGARRITMIGLVLSACMLPILGHAWSFQSAVWLFVAQVAVATFVVTPSLAYMGEATNDAGVRSFGVAYGLYNLAWGAGLLSGPAIGGFLFERIGFQNVAYAWAPPLALVTFVLCECGRSQVARPADTRHDRPHCVADSIAARPRPSLDRQVCAEFGSNMSTCFAGLALNDGRLARERFDSHAVGQP